MRTTPVRGAALFTLSALASFCTLTRLSYLVFICACFCAAVLTFGKKPERGRWQPPLYFASGIALIVVGLSRLSSADTAGLQDAASLLERITEWGYYFQTLAKSDASSLLFGLGIVQNEKVLPMYPMLIDSVYLALILHIGVIGFLLFAFLLIKMWLYLCRKAVATRRPFVIAAAALWATLPCAGIFNIVFGAYGVVFAMAVLCDKNSQEGPGPGVDHAQANLVNPG